VAENWEPSPAFLREFLEAEKACPDPGLEVQQRVFSRLATTLAVGDGSPDAPDLAHPPLSHAGMRSGPLASAARALQRGWATFLVGAAVGATTYAAVEHSRHKPASPPPAAASSPMAPALPALDVPPPPERPAPAPAVLGRAREPQGAEPRNAPLSVERNLLEIARTALARGKTDTALAILRRQARQFPSGQLAEERDGLWIQALVAKGDYAQARERATHFHRQHPHSLFAPAVDQALQSIP
jgi:hypothetical protein